jgi:hypothetical protein
MPPDDDLVEGCEFSDKDEVISDEDIDGIVLFADIAGGDIDDIAKRKAEWEGLFGAKGS